MDPCGYEDNDLSEDNESGFAIASLVLGICSLIPCWYGCLSIIFGILAIVFGALGKKNAVSGKGKAKAGFIMGIVGVSLSVGLILFLIILNILQFLLLIVQNS